MVNSKQFGGWNIPSKKSKIFWDGIFHPKVIKTFLGMEYSIKKGEPVIKSKQFFGWTSPSKSSKLFLDETFHPKIALNELCVYIYIYMFLFCSLFPLSLYV